MTSNSENPYAAPKAEVADRDATASDEQQLASRGTRLAAALLDGLLVIPGVALLMYAMPETGWSDQPASAGIDTGFSMLAVLYFLIIMGINIYFLYKNGQSIGKKATDIKIVHMDGSRAGLGRILGLRILVNGLIGNIPLIGPFYGIVDVLFIFGRERRCVHDYIASTKVIVA